MPVDRWRLVSQLAVLGVGQAMLYFTMKWLIKQMDPNRDKKEEAAALSKRLLERLQRKNLSLDEYESMIAVDIVDPDDINVTFEDVGGLEKTITILQEELVLPLTQPEMFSRSSRLIQPPKGILLFGPPGCGKTMIAKALARECNCCFINLRPSSFMDKWYGESQKLIKALFSLAEKLQPTVIFIDEIDSFLRERSALDAESSALVKAQFMTLWDGFASSPDTRVVIVAASNRPEDVDRAILRRLPRTCHIGLPSEDQRLKILGVQLKHENVDRTVDLALLAQITTGYSGSDLHELCRNAAMGPVRHYMASGASSGKAASAAAATSPAAAAPAATLRAMCMSDFLRAKEAVEKPNSEGESGSQESKSGAGSAKPATGERPVRPRAGRSDSLDGLE